MHLPLAATVVVATLIAAWYCCWLRFFQRGGTRGCLPRVERQEVPWGTAATLLLLAFSFFFENLIGLLALGMGGAKPPALAPARVILATALNNALQLVLLPMLLGHWVGAQPVQMGITRRGWRRNLTIGLAAFVMVTPIVYTVHSLALRVSSTHDRHKVEEMLQGSRSAGQIALVVATAVLLAPLFEELFFRGILLQWMRSQTGSAPAFLVTMVSFALLRIHWQIPGVSAAVALGLGVGMDWLHRRSPAQGAILGSSILFALHHIYVWPSPIPLFALSLVLGTLFDRTQSLVAPVTFHALFNGLATAGLLLQA